MKQLLTKVDIMPRKYALLTNDGTACSETGICHTCKMIYGTEFIITPSDVEKRDFVDVSNNTAITCTKCGKK